MGSITMRQGERLSIWPGPEIPPHGPLAEHCDENEGPREGGLLLARVHDVAKQDKVGIPLAFNPNHSRARRSLNQDGENHVEMLLYSLHVQHR